MHLSDFDYYLPANKIAQIPANPRDSSKLLVLDTKNKTINHSTFLNLPSLLRNGDVLIINNSKVIPARIQGIKETGAVVELLVTRKIGACSWEALVKPGLKEKTDLILFDHQGKISSLRARVAKDLGYSRVIEFSKPLESFLNKLGSTPLPPYITAEGKKSAWYQTIFAKHAGSVAAPTASLHFTPRVIKKLIDKGIQLFPITLHVGPGTFLPVKSEKITEHKMHAEWASIPIETIKAIRKAKEEGRRVISVGTTATRTLEFFAKKINVCRSPLPPLVVPAKAGIQPVDHVHKKTVPASDTFSGWVDLFIYPGYKFNIIDGMITNFHLPKSTLLMLVSALAGQEFIKKAYEEAIAANYRFYSFGDAMLIV